MFGYYSNSDYFQLVYYENGDSLMDLAFYKLDEIAKIIFSKLSDKELTTLSQFTRDNMNAYTIRLLQGKYSAE